MIREFLDSNDDTEQGHAALHVIVLSRVIIYPDQEGASGTPGALGASGTPLRSVKSASPWRRKMKVVRHSDDSADSDSDVEEKKRRLLEASRAQMLMDRPSQVPFTISSLIKITSLKNAYYKFKGCIFPWTSAAKRNQGPTPNGFI